MATIGRFEDIDAWMDARVLVRAVYALSDHGSFARDFGLRDQMRRAAVSIMSNIAEGFERSSDKDFARFLYMSKASAGELRSQLYVALDLEYVQQESADELIDATEIVSRKIAGFIKYLRSNDAKENNH